MVAHQHSKYSGQKEGAGLFGTEEEQKPPREEDVALIFIREKRGCRVGSSGEGGGDEEGELERDEMKCKCLNEPLRDCWSTS